MRKPYIRLKGILGEVETRSESIFAEIWPESLSQLSHEILD